VRAEGARENRVPYLLVFVAAQTSCNVVVTWRVTALPTTAAVQAAILHAVRLLDGRLRSGIVVLRLFRRDRGRRTGHQRVDERHVFVHFGRGARQQTAQLGGHFGGRWRVDAANGRQHTRRRHHRRFFLNEIGFCGNNKQNKTVNDDST